MLSLVVFLTLATPAYADLTLQSLAQVDPLAVCTDGSPAAYYWKPATSSPSTWLVYLDGGGWCYDEESCTSRCGPFDAINSDNKLCSSKTLEGSKSIGGIFWPDNDHLGGANKVFVHYCTSDAHMGNATAMGYQFRGHQVVQAVLSDLVDRRGLGSQSLSSQDRDLLIFGGGSAGARGAMVHLDYVQEMLGAAGGNVDVVGFLDSNYWVDVDLYNGSSFIGFPLITRHVHSYANVQHLGSTCVAAYEEQDQWKCMFGQYRMHHVTTRHFMVASQYDSFQLGNLLQGSPPYPLDAVAYAEQFAQKTRAELEKLAVSESDNALFSWACSNHMTSLGHSGFDELTCSAPATSTMDNALREFLGWSSQANSLGGAMAELVGWSSQANSLGGAWAELVEWSSYASSSDVAGAEVTRWLSQANSPDMTWIDTCDGFACGPGCGSSNSLIV